MMHTKRNKQYSSVYIEFLLIAFFFPLSMVSLREFKRRACTRLLEKLIDFKSRLGLEEFKNKLEDLHTAFLAFKSAFSIPKIEDARKEEKSITKEGRIERHSAGLFVFIVVDGTVIDICAEYAELAPVFVNRKIEDAQHLAEMYRDYREKCCDVCGQYFHLPFYETPVGRQLENDFVLSFHESCRKDLSTLV